MKAQAARPGRPLPARGAARSTRRCYSRGRAVPHDVKLLTPEQFLLTTLMVQLAIVATLATMLVRFRRFRRILLTERRDWEERARR